MKNCIFCKIVRNESAAHKIWEDENFLAFLTLGALNNGHTLLIPKKHTDYIFDLKEPIYTLIFQTAKQLSEPIRKAMSAKRIGIVVEGFTVPHAHLHLVPLHNEDEIDASRVKKIEQKILAETAENIRTQIEKNKL